MPKNATKAEKAHMGAVKELGCLACLIEFKKFRVATIHHVRKHSGRRNHMKTLGLCGDHHYQWGEFKNALHKNRRLFEKTIGIEEDLLNMVANLLANKNEGFTKIPF